MKHLSVIFLLAFSLSSCVSERYVKIDNNTDDGIDLYFSKKPEQNYTEVCVVELISINVFHTKKKMLQKLKDKAKNKDCDALIINNLDYVNILLIPFNRVEAVMIKYQN